METSTYTTTVLTASEGYVLTESAEVGIETRTLTPKIYLAATASPEDWREIPKEEADAIRIEQERLRKEREEKRKEELEAELRGLPDNVSEE